MPNEKIDIASLFPEDICDLFSNLTVKTGVKFEKYRAKQVFSWLSKGVSDFADMTNLPLSMIRILSEECYIALPTVKQKYVSALDGTVKYLFRLHDGECVESVFMRYNHGNTVCISTQAGCRMGCSFCASTIAGLSRSLTASEILGQVLAAENDTGERITNIVMMGIGEPLDNYENSVRFLRLINHPEGRNIGYRHISLSTCGLVDGIRKLAEENLPITLSISLHAPTQEMREGIMPVARKWKLDELISACRDYIGVTGRRICFEYAMIDGVNDTHEAAHTLSKLLSGMLCHVNLIPLNTVKERNLRKSSAKTIEEFIAILEKGHITATVRRRLGSDINASCGQLRRDDSKSEESIAE